MEKSSKNKHVGKVGRTVAGVKIVLILTFYFFSIVSLKLFYIGKNSEGMPVAAKPRAEELVKIYSIVKSHRPDLDDTEVWKVSGVILDESLQHGMDPILIVALIQIESGFRYQAVSPMGARGIMQIMPHVAEALAREIGVAQNPEAKLFEPEHLDDPVFNIKLGVYYLNDLKKNFRNLNLALSAYNIGPTKIRNRLENKINFSEHYAAAVLGAYEKYKTEPHPAF